jgi:hypothetical protein
MVGQWYKHRQIVRDDMTIQDLEFNRSEVRAFVCKHALKDSPDTGLANIVFTPDPPRMVFRPQQGLHLRTNFGGPITLVPSALSLKVVTISGVDFFLDGSSAIEQSFVYPAWFVPRVENPQDMATLRFSEVKKSQSPFAIYTLPFLELPPLYDKSQPIVLTRPWFPREAENVLANAGSKKSQEKAKAQSLHAMLVHMGIISDPSGDSVVEDPADTDEVKKRKRSKAKDTEVRKRAKHLLT